MPLIPLLTPKIQELKIHCELYTRLCCVNVPNVWWHNVKIRHKTKFQALIQKNNLDRHVSEPRRSNENPVESTVLEIKRKSYRVARKKNVPPRLWDYLLNWITKTWNITVFSSKYAYGRVPIEIIAGAWRTESNWIKRTLGFGLNAINCFFYFAPHSSFFGSMKKK